MNREILFRGKRVDNDEWVYGYLVKMFGVLNIIDKDNENIVYEIKPETVGEFTNLTDKNGNKIFEGDIVKAVCYFDETYREPMPVEFHIGRRGWFPFACGDGCGCCEEYTYLPEETEVIGNIYDNKEKE